jgi:hypothetical protein
MRTLTIMAACVALGLVFPASGQPQVDSNSAIAMPSEGGSRQVYPIVVVAELDSLPKPVREQVNASVSRRTDAELASLRHSIGVIPEASAALKAKGKSATEVIAAAIDVDGTLLLITTTAV